jgi:hypothetical protein
VLKHELGDCELLGHAKKCVLYTLEVLFIFQDAPWDNVNTLSFDTIMLVGY